MGAVCTNNFGKDDGEFGKLRTQSLSGALMLLLISKEYEKGMIQSGHSLLAFYNLKQKSKYMREADIGSSPKLSKGNSISLVLSGE